MTDIIRKSKAQHNRWHERWKSNNIGFHESEGNTLLKQHFEALNISSGQHIFLPLCGKTKDIGWLVSKGLRVSGIELNESAIVQLFEELNIIPVIERLDNLSLYSAENIKIYVGDFFELTNMQLGVVDAVFDRAALVALPSDLRKDYTKHLADITSKAKQLLVCYDYDERTLNGPPYSVTEQEVHAHYNTLYNIEKAYRKPVENGFRGQNNVFEAAYLLNSHNV